MAALRGSIEGNRGAASRLGSKSSGMRVQANTWISDNRIWLDHNGDCLFVVEGYRSSRNAIRVSFNADNLVKAAELGDSDTLEALKKAEDAICTADSAAARAVYREQHGVEQKENQVQRTLSLAREVPGGHGGGTKTTFGGGDAYDG